MKSSSRRALCGRGTPRLARLLAETSPGWATDSDYERSFYTRDISPIPKIMDRVFATTPDVVVRPRSTEEVAEVVRQAAADHVPVTPRAGASTALWGSIPVRGGIVLDLSGLKGLVALDTGRGTVRVLAGTVWTDLEHELEPHGLALRSYPSSAPASAVGAWLCTGGYGIGTLKYGRFVSQVRSAQVVLADGSVREITPETDPPLDWFVGSEGTLGIVTEVEIDIRPASAMFHHLLLCPGISAVAEIVSTLLTAPQVPFAVHFDDRRTTAALGALGYGPAGGEPDVEMVRIDWEGPPEEREAAEAAVQHAVAMATGVRLLPTESGEEEWAQRYKALRIKRGGPSVLGQEVLLPLPRLESYFRDMERLARRHRVRLMSYGHVADQERVVVMTMFYADETRTLPYLLSLGLIKKLQDLGARHGGLSYGLAFWSAPHLRRRLADPPVPEWRRRKRALDPAGIMNPGKGPSRLWVMNPLLIRTGMEALAQTRRLAVRWSVWTGA